MVRVNFMAALLYWIASYCASVPDEVTSECLCVPLLLKQNLCHFTLADADYKCVNILLIKKKIV